MVIDRRNLPQFRTADTLIKGAGDAYIDVYLHDMLAEVTQAVGEIEKAEKLFPDPVFSRKGSKRLKSTTDNYVQKLDKCMEMYEKLFGLSEMLGRQKFPLVGGNGGDASGFYKVFRDIPRLNRYNGDYLKFVHDYQRWLDMSKNMIWRVFTDINAIAHTYMVARGNDMEVGEMTLYPKLLMCDSSVKMEDSPDFRKLMSAMSPDINYVLNMGNSDSFAVASIQTMSDGDRCLNVFGERMGLGGHQKIINFYEILSSKNNMLTENVVGLTARDREIIYCFLSYLEKYVTAERKIENITRTVKPRDRDEVLKRFMDTNLIPVSPFYIDGDTVKTIKLGGNLPRSSGYTQASRVCGGYMRRKPGTDKDAVKDVSVSAYRTHRDTYKGEFDTGTVLTERT